MSPPLRDDAQLKLAVAALKHRFFAHAEALLHGDIHSGRSSLPKVA